MVNLDFETSVPYDNDPPSKGTWRAARSISRTSKGNSNWNVIGTSRTEHYLPEPLLRYLTFEIDDPAQEQTLW